MPGRFPPFPVGVLAFLLLGAPLVRAQSYAPETEFHDRTQRHFVVELARVLAWRVNQGTAPPKVAEVTDELSLSADRRVTWKIHWLDAAGKAVRDAEVSYPESALTGGAAWYRDVARQLAVPAVPGAPGSEDELIQSYWKGAESAQPSRAESLGAAFALAPEKDAARLAGLLAHTAMPAVVGGVSLDAVLLARAAAWLCVAEQSVKTPDAKLDALWAPILFLSGRENVAADLWKKAAPTPADGTLAKGWGFLLARPGSADAFAFAADPQNRRWAMPLLAYETNLYDLREVLPGVIEKVFGDEKSLSALHDYGPFLVLETGVGGGHLAGGLPLASRRAWVDCLRQFKPEATDYQGYADTLRQLKPGPPEGGNEDNESSLTGLADAAPLLNLGFREGRGKLTPVAVVTARDLLNFGWEMNGLQMGRRWQFLADSLGVRDEADALAKASLGVLDACECFFADFPYARLNDRACPAWKFIKRTRLDDAKRLQEIDDAAGESVAQGKAFNTNKGENALLWLRRCWLRPTHVLNQSRELFFGNEKKDIVPLLRRLCAEGGPMTSYHALSFFAYGLNKFGVPQVPGSDALRLDLLAAQAEPSGVMYLAAWDKYEELPPFQAAQELEKLFWRRPGSDLPYNQIFSDYLAAHAYDAARRFYRQAEEIVNDGVGFSNDLGPRRFMLALMEKDRPGMKDALRASSSGSYSDMVVNIMAAAAQDDFKTLAAQVDECLERYPPASDKGDDMMRKLKAFLPLVPAFKDPANPDHAKVIDFFAKYTQWPTLQWVFLQNTKLSTDEAVRFLGGRETNPERLEMVAYLLGDKELFTKTYDAIQGKQYRGKSGWSNMAFVVVHYLRNDLLGVPVPADQPDLQAPGARSLQQAVEAKLEGGAVAQATEDLSKYADADALWKRIEEMRQGPAAQPTTRAEVMAYLDGVVAATAEFSKRYPKDPRRWGAKLLGTQMGALLAQVSGKDVDAAGQETALQEIADATDATVEARSEARFALVQTHIAEASEETLNPAQEKEIAAFAHDFPQSPHNGELQLLRVKSLLQSDPAQGEALLAKLAKDPNPDVAQEAAAQIQMREVTKKPLEMKFTALDGSTVDVSKLRGKVVLIDFWATWCGPCMAEVPEVVETYQKLHGRGFEVVGISLDEDGDKAKVVSVTRDKGMVWPQFFDGKGWQNEISSRYAITSIPRMWLVNKKGMVVDTEARENLSDAVEKLLGE